MWFIPIAAAAASYLASQEDRDAQTQWNYRQEALQREFAQNAIQWRVADAKKAGLHPLFALGGAGASYSPTIYAGDQGAAADAAQGVGRGLEELVAEFRKKGEVSSEGDLPWTGGPWTREGEVDLIPESEWQKRFRWKMSKGEMDMLEIQKQAAELALREAQLRANNERHASDTSPVGAGAWEYRPDSVISPNTEKGYLTAGRHPGWTTYQLDNSFSAILPAGSSMSESLESISESKIILGAVIARNVAEFGPGWVEQAKQYLPWMFK